MIEGLWLVSIGIATLIFVLIWKIKYRYSYFERLGVPFVKPTWILGSYPKAVLGQASIGECYTYMYNALKGEKIGGFFLGWMPHWIVRDPDFVHSILVSNFEIFPDRGLMVDEKVNPLEYNLFFLNGSKWKFLKKKLSPIFTQGKLKYMYSQIEECYETLVQIFEEQEREGRDIEPLTNFSRYTTDVIASTAFGLKTNAQRNPNSIFQKMGKSYFDLGIRNKLVAMYRYAFPQLLIALKVRTTKKSVTDYFLNLIRDVLRVRRETGATRNDFIQLAMEVQKGKIELDPEDEIGDSYSSEQSPFTNFEMTDDVLAAQSYVFLIAAFETTSVTLNFAAYLISNHKDIQDKIRTQIREVKKKHGGFTFESLKSLTLLENAILETMRMHSPVPWLVRHCRQTFTFPNGVTVSKGDEIAIPLMSLHDDENYFPEPKVFKPERFETPPRKGTYMPFGDGPRICIGKRFAEVVMRMTLAKLLDKFEFLPSPNNPENFEYDEGMTLGTKKPLLIRVKKLDDSC